MYKGIDVSRYQGIINWEKVKPNIDFAIIRAGFGNNNIDARARYNFAECERLGIPYGFYWMSYALSPEMARKEAQYLVQFVGEHKAAYPLVYDFEYDSIYYCERNGVKVTRDFVLKCTRAFCEELESHKFYAMFYTNNDFYKRYYQASDIVDRFDMWFARYASTPGRKCFLWQKSETGRIPGINERVDLDESFRDYEAIMKKAQLNNY